MLIGRLLHHQWIREGADRSRANGRQPHLRLRQSSTFPRQLPRRDPFDGREGREDDQYDAGQDVPSRSGEDGEFIDPSSLSLSRSRFVAFDASRLERAGTDELSTMMGLDSNRAETRSRPPFPTSDPTSPSLSSSERLESFPIRRSSSTSATTRTIPPCWICSSLVSRRRS